MVRSHAKTNTTQANLTHYERSLLRKDGAARRLGHDSFKPLDHCYLCLTRVSDPVSCSHGHMFCRECAISNLITQKASIEMAKRDLEAWGAREEREKQMARESARERVVKNFEKSMGLGMGAGIRIGTPKDGTRGAGAGADDKKEGANGLSKVEELARRAEDEALRAIEAEQVEARKSKLAAFWLPSMAPEGRLTPIKDVKLETMCQAGKEAHPMSRKSLLPVILSYPTPKSTTPSCPSCTKELSNATNAILLSSRKPAAPPTPAETDDEPPAKKKKKGKKDEAPFVCGHVVCKNCSDTIVKPAGRCCVCEAEVDDAGRIPLGKEGTGFAAAGGSEVKPDRVAFRV